MTSLGTLDLNFLTLRRLFPYRNATTDICANTILLQNARGEPVWIDPADVFGDVSGTLVAKGNCDSDYLYWDQGSQLWLAGGKRIHIGCEAGVVQPDVSGTAIAIGYNAGYRQQASTSIALGQYAGYSTQGAGAVAMGSYAGYWNQRADGVAIGASAGVSTQGSGSIAIGASAGAVTQDASAVAIGFNAGLNIQGRGAVAMGAYAGYMDQSGSAVAVGLYAGNIEQGINTVAVGAGAGRVCQTANAVAVGNSAGSGNQGASAVAIGESAGAITQGTGGIAIGSLAGSSTQLVNAIAIGSNAGRTTQGVGSVAIGALAGSNVQRDGAVAVGSNAGYDSQGLNAVAMGLGAGYSTQGTGAIAIGSNAGYSSQGAGAVAMGMGAGFSSQGANAVAIGSNAGFGLQSVGAVAMGARAGYSTQGAGAVAIGLNAGYSTQGTGAVALGSSAGWSSQGAGAVAVGLNAGLSTQGAGAVAMGSSAGAVDQSANAVAIGLGAGTLSQGASAVAIGWTAGSNLQGTGSVAVGLGAGFSTQGTNAVAIGLGAGYSTQGSGAIAIGSNAGYSTQGTGAIGMGMAAGISSQGTNAIAIGSNAGGVVQGVGAIAVGARAGLSNQNSYAIAIGSNAGVTDQSGSAVAIGFGAGSSVQDINAVAIGSNAGFTTQGNSAVAIGAGAGLTAQGIHAIAIGSNAGATNQGQGGIAIGAIPASHVQSAGAIAIGYNAITVGQSANAIAIGNSVCGANTQGVNSIAIGSNAIGGSQPANSIILNAKGSAINATQPSALYIDPIRNTSDDLTTTAYVVQYNPGSKEVIYNSTISINSGAGIINVSGDILPTVDIKYSLGSSALAFKHLYVSSIISDTSNVAISGDIVPYADNLYSVGLSTLRWKDVFVGPGSVYIGGATNATRAILSASGDALLINSGTTGNVGIATNSPAAKLHVQGTTLLNDTVTAGGNIVPDISGTRDLGQNLVRWRNIYTDNIFVTSGFSLTGNFLPSADDQYSLGISTLRWEDLYIGTGTVYIGGTTSGTRAEVTSATNNLIINATNGGSVGIGTNNPTVSLDVSGFGAIRGDGLLARFSVGGATQPGRQLNMGYDTTNNYGFITATELGVGQRNLAINRLGGNVGIGTTDPAFTLDVNGATKARNMTMRSDTSDVQNALYFDYGTSSITNVFAIYRPAGTNDLRFYNYSNISDLMSLTSAGNVGIGTTNPQATTHVHTDSGATTTSMWVTNNFFGTNTTGSDFVESQLVLGSTYSGSPYYTTIRAVVPPGSAGDVVRMDFCTPQDSNTNLPQIPRMTILSGAGYGGATRVGIGTTTPATQLHLYNGSATDNVLRITTEYGGFSQPFDRSYSRILLSSRASGLYGGGIHVTIPAGFPNENQSNLEFTTSDNDGLQVVRMTILGTSNPKGGNVGIGTTDPGYTLDVNGDVNIRSGFVYRINTQTVLTATNWIFAAGSINYGGGGASLASGYNVSSVTVVAGGQIRINFLNNYSSGFASDAKNYPMTCSPIGDYLFVYPVTQLNGSVLVYIVDGAGSGREQAFNFIIIKTGDT